MKILHVINGLGTGGAEKLLLETLPIYNLEKNITVDLLLLNGNEHPFLTQLIKINCCKVFTLGYSSVYNPFLIFKIIPYLKKYTIVHVHLFPALYWVALAKLLSFSKIQLIFTEHNTTNRRMKMPVFKVLDKFIYSQYKKIVTISKKVDFEIKKYLNLKPNQNILIQNGINLQNIFNAQKNNAIIQEFQLNSKKIIIQVSRFEAQKNQKTLIKAMKYMPDEVVLLLVGSGVLIEECKTLVRNLNLLEKVHFLGIRTDVPSLLKTADFVVLSSHYEGLSLSSVEGLASGKPFIASNVPGLTEVVEGAGLLFKDNDEVELANYIKNLLNNQEFYNETVQKCIERAKNFDIQLMVEKHIELYKTL